LQLFLLFCCHPVRDLLLSLPLRESQVERPPHFAFVLASLGVILKDPLLSLALAFIFRVFRPKIACQAQKPPNPLPINNIRVAC
jgi:hypothetical protein